MCVKIPARVAWIFDNKSLQHYRSTTPISHFKMTFRVIKSFKSYAEQATMAILSYTLFFFVTFLSFMTHRGKGLLHKMFFIMRHLKVPSFQTNIFSSGFQWGKIEISAKKSEIFGPKLCSKTSSLRFSNLSSGMT